MSPIETIQHNGHTIKIFADDDPPDPRENDHLGKILYCSSRYELGDEHKSAEEIDTIANQDDVIVMDVYAYIHSGIVLRACDRNPFTCRFDSGKSGIIYCGIEAAKEAFGCEGDEMVDRAKKCFVAEVDELSKYLNGEVYLYDIDGECCGGFYSVEDAIEAAKEQVG